MSEGVPDIAILESFIFDPQCQKLEDVLQEESYPQLDTKMIIPSNVLSTEEYPGPYQFEVCIIPVASKQPWVYSAALNKVYMDMLNPFPIDFKIKGGGNELLFVRATPKYSHPNYYHDLVTRCINHEHEHEKSNKDIKDALHRQHIIRCHNPNTYYVGDKTKNERLSVLIPLSQPEPGSDSVKEMYEFVCKNSCPMPGMNRRPLEIIFTLENMNCEILGRRVLNVRICSCPKRDKEKEEAEHNSPNNPVPHGKKRKLSSGKIDKKVNAPSDIGKDTKIYTLTLKVAGKHNVQNILKYAHDLMAGEILRAPQGTEGPFKKCLTELNQQGN